MKNNLSNLGETRMTPREIEYNKKLLDKIAVVNLNLSRWTGTTQIDESESMVNSKARNKLSIQILPDTKLKPYHTIRNRLYMIWLEKIGLKFMGGWIIPVSQIDATHNYFSEQKDEYQTFINDIEKEYDRYYKKAYNENPKFRNLLSEPRFKKENIMKRFGFEWDFFMMAPVVSRFLRNEFMTKMEKLETVLYQDVSIKAEELWQKKLNKESLTSRIASPVKDIKFKFEIFGFLSPLVPSTIRLIEAALLNLPDKFNNKPLSVELSEQVKSLLWVMKEPERCLLYSGRISEGQAPYKILDEVGKTRQLTGRYFPTSEQV
jgi:hypothetical protein